MTLGLPNAGSVQQDTDALYGSFKSATYFAWRSAVVTELLKERGAARRKGKAFSALLNFEFLAIWSNKCAK
jgi:hypothetical protein